MHEAIQLKQQPIFYCNRANIYEQLSRWIEMQQDQIRQQITATQLTDNAMIALGDYALEQGYADIASLTGIGVSKQMPNQAQKSGCYQQLIHGDIVHNLTPSGDINLIMAADILIYLGGLSTLFSNAYQTLSEEAGFTHGLSNECSLHLEKNKPVAGEIYLLQKPGRTP